MPDRAPHTVKGRCCYCGSQFERDQTLQDEIHMCYACHRLFAVHLVCAITVARIEGQAAKRSPAQSYTEAL